MKRTLTAVALVAWALPLLAAPMTEEQKTLYAVGQIMGRQLGVFTLNPAELEVVKQGLSDAALNKPAAVEMEVYGPKVQALAQARRAAEAQRQGPAGVAFAAKAAQEKGAIKTASGLVYLPLVVGKGASPKPTDQVRVHYRGTLIDGTEFDSSYKRGEPAEFGLGQVIKCWQEGVSKMQPGGKARLVCPPEIAYGESGSSGKIPPHATLVFEVELLAVLKS